MREGSRYLIGIICLVTLLLTLTGCFSTTADNLYSLPQASKEYLELQKQIDIVLDSGAVYSPPTSGPNRQSVQLKDIDGDGKNEAIAFFRMTGDKPLKIYILKQVSGTYEVVNIIDGDGTSIESVRYADMDGDGVNELVIGWQMSAALLHMTIYSVRDDEHTLLADSDFSKLVTGDIDGDEHTDVIVLRLSSAEVDGVVDTFSLRTDGEIVTSSARLSTGIESISRILKGNLVDGTSAIFVEGDFEGNSIITDIFYWKDESLHNVFAKAPDIISEETIRAYQIFSTDINSDGIIEVPAPRMLESASDQTYYVIDWYSFDRNGNKSLVYTTYHNYQDGWYLILPNEWKDKITVRRDDLVAGERTMIFSWLSGDDSPDTDFLKIYALSGDNKEDRANLAGRSKLPEHGDTIYAADILTTESGATISRGNIAANFKLIYSAWETGVY